MLTVSHGSTASYKKDTFVDISESIAIATKLTDKELRSPPTNYSATNYTLSKTTSPSNAKLNWNKKAVIKGPLIVPSLHAIGFKTNNGERQSLLNRLSGTKGDIVRHCAASRKTDRALVENTLTNVDRQIGFHNQTLKTVKFIGKKYKTIYDKFKNTKNEIKKALQINCRFTADNTIPEVYFDNKPLKLIGGNPNAWWQSKIFKISSFKDGKVFACMCQNAEKTSSNTEYVHSNSGGLIVKSDVPDYFSTDFTKIFSTDFTKCKWKVRASLIENDHPPRDKANREWYENDYDDSDSDSKWDNPVQSSSLFYLEDFDKTNNKFKIWAKGTGKKYVWFRYKDKER